MVYCGQQKIKITPKIKEVRKALYSQDYSITPDFRGGFCLESIAPKNLKKGIKFNRMQLFSKRNRTEPDQRGAFYSERIRDNSFITAELRNRLAAEISFLTSVNDFLEFFILFENQKKETIFLDSSKVDGFSLTELGYKMTDYFEFENFAIKEFQVSRQIPTRTSEGKMERVNRVENFFDDYKLFDLVECIILFSKKNKRDELVNRFNDILSEENASYEIINGMITKKSGEDIYTIKNLLKDENLKRKIEDYKYYKDRRDYSNTAKVSAEIINIVFSNEKKEKKKTEIDKVLSNASAALAINKKDSDALHGYLGTILTDIRDLNNNIYNIRHTEKSTVHLKDAMSNILYKAIAETNLSFIETILLSLKDDFIYSEDWELIKNSYIKKYNINKDQRFIIKKPEIRIEDVPF